MHHVEVGNLHPSRCNGADLEFGLRLRMSSREIISVISRKMLDRLCPQVIAKTEEAENCLLCWMNLLLMPPLVCSFVI